MSKKFALNKNQKKAVENIDSNLVVMAGAGTGKTKVLVERYMEILENGDLEKSREIESIVAITFTKKAAQEMIDRIRTSLREKFSRGEKWLRFYRDIEKANISTIHSFCGKILRENTVELGLDPKFKVLDENLSSKLLMEACEEIVLEELEENPVFYDLLKKLEATFISALLENFLELYNKFRNDRLEIEDFGQKIYEEINNLELDRNLIGEIREDYKFLMEHISRGKLLDLKEDERYLKFMTSEASSNSEILDSLIYMEEFLGNYKNYQDYVDRIKLNTNRARRILEKENLKYYMEILNILEKIDRLYSKKKKEQAGLDYDDLQIKMNELLDRQGYRKYYQEKYKYLMVDEFQDTNRLQKEIFYKLASKEDKLDRQNLFIVGDPKQSIYGFRGGDLEVFYRAMEDIAGEDKSKLIELDENYRTSENIMNFINSLFGNLMGDNYGRLRPNVASKLDFEVEVLEDKELEIPASQSMATYSREFEADLIGRRIRKLVDEGFCQYRDIALLFRAKTRNCIYEAGLEKYEIPYYNISASGLFEKWEIVDLINAFKSFLNPKDLVSNVGFLRSPMMGLTDEDLYLLMREEGSIVERLEKLVIGGQAEDGELIQACLDIYKYLFKAKYQLNNYEFLNELIEITNYREILLLLDGGKQRYANLDKLLEIFLSYEENHMGENYDILEYIEELRSRELAEASVISESDNSVKILTIHKAKGLEFPVVILPEMSLGDFRDNKFINYNRKLGLGLNIPNYKANFKLILEADEEKERQEDLRILYVAMTRAENLLILGNQGGNRGFKKVIKDYLIGEDIRFIKEIDVINYDKSDQQYIAEDLTLDGDLYPKNILEFSDYNREKIYSFTISQFMKFRNCQREYFLDHVLKLGRSLDVTCQENELKKDSSNLISPLDRGNIVHRFCELYRLGLDEDVLLEKISKQFSLDFSLVRKEVGHYLKNYLKSYEEYGEEYREREFNIKIENARFTGIIDRINIVDGEIEIIDYKTNRLVNKDILYQQYKDQLRFYAYTVAHIFKQKVGSAKLHLLETGEYLEIDLEEGKISESIKKLEDFVEFVNKYSKLEEYEQSQSCSEKCRYFRICKKDGACN